MFWNNIYLFLYIFLLPESNFEGICVYKEAVYIDVITRNTFMRCKRRRFANYNSFIYSSRALSHAKQLIQKN